MDVEGAKTIHRIKPPAADAYLEFCVRVREAEGKVGGAVGVLQRVVLEAHDKVVLLHLDRGTNHSTRSESQHASNGR